MSAATLTEALIVAAGRGFNDEMRDLISLFELQVIDVTAPRAELAAAAYRQFGKNFHPAGLNYRDCFASATAKEFGCPLLYVGQDFSRTDIVPALTAEQT
jgi:ribonuclease VapC